MYKNKVKNLFTNVSNRSNGINRRTKSPKKNKMSLTKYNNNKIIAIGDIHGDYYIFIQLLRLSKVIDSNNNWIGKDTYVIQMGDTLDGKRPDTIIEKDFLRTTGEIEIIKLILKLDREAKKQGGRVISLLGNHELYPYYYYNDNSFNDKYVKLCDLKNYEKKYGVTRFKYFKPGTGNGAKILGKTRPVLIQLGQFIFCHGSLNKKFLQTCLDNKLGKLEKPNKLDIKKLNKIVSDWLTGKSKKVPFFINSTDNVNPLFNRDLSNPKTLTKSECSVLIHPIFDYFENAKYLVLGHSVHNNINAICENKVYRTDIGLSRAFGGSLKSKMNKLQVLEIKQKNKKVSTNIITINGKKKIL